MKCMPLGMLLVVEIFKGCALYIDQNKVVQDTL